MRLSCTNCGSSIEVPQEWVARAQGMSVPCKQCGADIGVEPLAPPPLPGRRPQQDVPPPLAAASRSGAHAAVEAPAKTGPTPRHQTSGASLRPAAAAPAPSHADETQLHTDAVDYEPTPPLLAGPQPMPKAAGANLPPAQDNAPSSSAAPPRPPLGRAVRWLAVALAVVVASALVHHLFWRIPAADTYTALEHERHMRAELATEVLAGMKEFAQLAAGDPNSIAVAASAVAELEAKITQRALDLEGDVSVVATQVSTTQDELNRLTTLASLGRIRERRMTGSRWVDDWNGGHFEASYAVGFKTCGADQCGGSCGVCGDTEVCYASYCRCVPKCLGKMCGADGCGGVCGACGADSFCRDGSCARKPLPPQAAPAGCTPVCGEVAPTLSKGQKGKGLAGLFTVGTSGDKDATPGSLAALRLTFAALVDRGQSLPAEQLADWLAALDAELASLTKVAAEMGEARAEQPKLAAELAELGSKLKAAKDAEKAANKELSAAQKAAAKDAASPVAGQLETLGQAAKSASEAVAKLTEQQTLVKGKLTLTEKRIKDLEKRAKLADSLRPQLITERSNFAKLLTRIDEVRKSLASDEARLDQAKRTKDIEVAKLRSELAPKLAPARLRLAGLAKPFVPLAGQPHGDRVGGQSGNYLAAPEALAHLAVGPVETDAVLQARLDEYLLRGRALLDLRRRAWDKLSQAERGKFAEWPAVDNGLEQHIAHIEALVASNARLARIWLRIGG